MPTVELGGGEAPVGPCRQVGEGLRAVGEATRGLTERSVCFVGGLGRRDHVPGALTRFGAGVSETSVTMRGLCMLGQLFLCVRKGGFAVLITTYGFPGRGVAALQCRRSCLRGGRVHESRRLPAGVRGRRKMYAWGSFMSCIGR